MKVQVDNAIGVLQGWSLRFLRREHGFRGLGVWGFGGLGVRGVRFRVGFQGFGLLSSAPLWSGLSLKLLS